MLVTGPVVWVCPSVVALGGDNVCVLEVSTGAAACTLVLCVFDQLGVCVLVSVSVPVLTSGCCDIVLRFGRPCHCSATVHDRTLTAVRGAGRGYAKSKARGFSTSSPASFLERRGVYGALLVKRFKHNRWAARFACLAVPGTGGKVTRSSRVSSILQRPSRKVS